MYIYYVLIDGALSYYESDEKLNKKHFKELFEGRDDERIAVYDGCCNFGLIGLVYKNYSI